ncbi:MAG: hypothetical protein HC897_04430 [Thermoanaerobaculia bacterium]|nr:hypothetical protein [Thermoanaerobaculia bacterium]
MATTVPVGAFPRDVAITPDGTRAWVSNYNSGTVSVIDTATQTVVSTFPASPQPWGIDFMPDSDVDGVGEIFDLCPLTPAGELVEPATGCSIDQLCPCDSPFGSTQPWKNHGVYVLCVNRTARTFYELGLLTSAEKHAIIAAARASSCGT